MATTSVSLEKSQFLSWEDRRTLSCLDITKFSTTMSKLRQYDASEVTTSNLTWKKMTILRCSHHQNNNKILLTKWKYSKYRGLCHRNRCDFSRHILQWYLFSRNMSIHHLWTSYLLFDNQNMSEYFHCYSVDYIVFLHYITFIGFNLYFKICTLFVFFKAI